MRQGVSAFQTGKRGGGGVDSMCHLVYLIRANFMMCRVRIQYKYRVLPETAVSFIDDI